MTRALFAAVAAAALVAYAVLRIVVSGRPVLPYAVGCALGLVVVGLLARRQR